MSRDKPCQCLSLLLGLSLNLKGNATQEPGSERGQCVPAVDRSLFCGSLIDCRSGSSSTLSNADWKGDYWYHVLSMSDQPSPCHLWGGAHTQQALPLCPLGVAQKGPVLFCDVLGFQKCQRHVTSTGSGSGLHFIWNPIFPGTSDPRSTFRMGQTQCPLREGTHTGRGPPGDRLNQ